LVSKVNNPPILLISLPFATVLSLIRFAIMLSQPKGCGNLPRKR
jgi:hypothetical protein